MSLLRAHGSAELRKIVSGFATQGLRLGDRKVGSQVDGRDRNRLPESGTVGGVRRGERWRGRADNRTKEKRHRFRVRFRKDRKARRLACFSLGFGDDRRGISGSRDVGLTIFIPSMSRSKSLMFFTNRFFDFRRPPGMRLSFDATERNGKFGRI